MGKLSTPDWIREGYDSKEDYEKAKGIKSSSKKGKFKKIKVCPKCGAKEIRVVLGGEEGKGSCGWECLKCKWKGEEVDEKELNEEDFLKFIEGKIK